ncbi:AprI/Inh family metalloprotease inhibitor [Rhizobium sp. RU36D]|uniref:AprI/Inh family metalloprotease inhibitor n=1 Tax=Rhizobium sp. RU36D TaxID=1907415 RepID=UPI0009D7AFB0|nr:AprI/Inh family metalloprotease inhibitor [Rhizobium sp. RU36D]SMC58147.1 Protease inhibitor Inh [Rhizobium sp. RU36D]
MIGAAILLRWFGALGAILAVFAALPGTASAQANYVGNWTVDTGSMAGSCKLELSQQAFGGLPKATTFTCLGPLAFAQNWQPSGNGFTVYGLNRMPIASFSPERGRMVGRLSDGSIATLTPGSGQQFGFAQGGGFQSGGKCIHHPQSGYCAPPEDMTVPRRATNVLVLHPLAVRTDQDLNSKQIGLVEKGQCVRIDGCLDTRWGPRCLIKLNNGTVQGYINKFFTQKDTTFVGFSVGC